MLNYCFGTAAVVVAGHPCELNYVPNGLNYVLPSLIYVLPPPAA